MDLSCLPAPVVADMARVSMMALPPVLAGKLAQWERLAPEERERAAGDLALMAGLAAR